MNKKPTSESGPGSLPKGCWWILPGKLLAGPVPKHSVRALRLLGVKMRIDLRAELSGEEILAAQKDSRLQMEHFPIADYSLPEINVLREICTVLSTALEQNKLIYLHCHGGCGRTGVVAGALLYWLGLVPGDALLAHLANLRKDAALMQACPETAEQRAFLELGCPGLNSGSSIK